MIPALAHKSLIFVLAVTVVLAFGCGDNDLEEQLERASQAVAEARAQLEQTRGDVEAKENAVADAKAGLDAAKTELEEARAAQMEHEQALAKAEERIYGGETDALLFRAVQQRLLEDDALKGSAVSAQVARGRVTLRGQVGSDRLRDRALEVASETPGVVEVRDELVVRAPAQDRDAAEPADS